MELSAVQQKIIEAPESKIVVIAAAGSGKAEPNTTIIPTPEGYKSIGELKIGDRVFNRFGEPETIVGVFPQGEQEIYRVSLSDGRQVLCAPDHLWSYDNERHGLATKNTKDMYEKGVYKLDKRGHKDYRFRIPNNSCVQYNEQEYDINPYVFGCFLGDGCCLESKLTISSADEELVSEIASILKCEYHKCHPNNYSWYFSKNNEAIHTNNFFINYKDNICCYCGEKSIPKNYLIGSKEQRLALLQGLMDTDGTTGDGRHSPSYSTTSKQLANDVAELTRSLGYYTTINVQDRPEKKSIEYKVNIFTTPQHCYEIFRLSRKRDKAKTFIDKKCRMKHNFISIIDIEPLGETTQMTCIYVDHPEHLYLTNSYVATHNTTVLTERLKRLVNNNVNPDKIVAITFTNAAADEMKERLGDISNGMFIGTVHSYANYLLRAHGIDTHNYLEKEDFDGLFHLVQKYPHCIKDVEHLLVDEVQDSTEEQFQFFEQIAPKNYFYVGDVRQSIYRWSGAKPDYIIDLTYHSDVKVYHLNENYRCGRTIIDFASSLIRLNGPDYDDNSRAMRSEQGQVADVVFSSSGITSGIKKYGNPGDWFVICRTNTEVETMCRALEVAGIPYDTFKKKDLTNKQLKERMSANKVKVLTIHAAKGLEAKYVAVVGVKFYNVEERCIAYVAATRARDLLVWTRTPAKSKFDNKYKVNKWE